MIHVTRYSPHGSPVTICYRAHTPHSHSLRCEHCARMSHNHIIQRDISELQSLLDNNGLITEDFSIK